ncbi:hypothetical protein WA026_008485 [Henosepilachna vigintioctopunctata]|uniref:Uncharacterized protein n=1 Tax=Henosepilachna vigintioctopunctata TaxID=420089 RepID=A0AAW1UKP6_9CUCU
MYIFLLCPAVNERIPLFSLKQFQNPDLEKKSGNAGEDPSNTQREGPTYDVYAGFLVEFQYSERDAFVMVSGTQRCSSQEGY